MSAQMTSTIMAFGAASAFVGWQVHLEVGGNYFYIDLLRSTSVGGVYGRQVQE